MKLSTSKIVEIITTSLINTDKILDDVVKTYVGNTPSIETLNDFTEMFGGCKPEIVVEKMKVAWLKPSNWKRYEKSKLKDDDLESWVGYFDPDVAGEMINKDAVGVGCILRVFCNKTEPFSDNFRLEILTNKEDQTIVAWTLIVD